MINHHHKKLFHLCSRCVIERPSPSIIVNIDNDTTNKTNSILNNNRYKISVNKKICNTLQSPKILKTFDDNELIQLLNQKHLLNIENNKNIPHELKQLTIKYLNNENKNRSKGKCKTCNHSENEHKKQNEPQFAF
eukprot:404117_1